MSQKSPIPHCLVDIFQISVYAGTRTISEELSSCGNAKKIYLVRKFSRIPAFFLFFWGKNKPQGNAIGQRRASEQSESSPYEKNSKKPAR